MARALKRHRLASAVRQAMPDLMATALLAYRCADIRVSRPVCFVRRSTIMPKSYYDDSIAAAAGRLHR